MRLLVTGGAGFVGSAFVRRARPGATIVVLDALTYAGDRANLEDAPHAFVHGDICDGPLVDRIVREHAIDQIVHFAAESHVDRSIDAPAAFIETNVVGTMRLLDVARAHRVRFHHVSTDEVYGSILEGSFDESSRYQPGSPYAASKASSDHLVRAWANTYGIATTISHGSNTYGPHQYPEKLVPVIVKRLIAKQPLPIYGDGKHVRDWLHVDDHADAIWTIVQRGVAGETYAIAGGAERENLALVHAMCDAFAALRDEDPATYRALVAFVADRPGHDRRYALSGAKLAALGWRPCIALADGLRDTIAWYLARA